jgi:hypothetical protein
MSLRYTPLQKSGSLSHQFTIVIPTEKFFYFDEESFHSVQGGSRDAESFHSVQGGSRDAESFHSVQGGSRDAESF